MSLFDSSRTLTGSVVIAIIDDTCAPFGTQWISKSQKARRQPKVHWAGHMFGRMVGHFIEIPLAVVKIRD